MKIKRGVFYNNLGLIYVHQKKYREAEKSFNISGVIVNKSEKHNLAILYDNLSNCYEHLNQYQLALKYLKKKNKCLDDEKRDIKINVFNELRRQDELKINVLKKKSNLQKIKLEKLKSNRLILFLVMLFIISALLISLLIFKNKKMKILVKLNIDNMQKVPENETKTIVNRKIPEKLVLQIEESITVDLIYIDPNITIQKMANLLETNVSDLSKAINSFYGMNFRTLINLKRVEYAKKMLLDNKYDNYSILGIAETVGYLNKASFYKNFKQLTGVTPANFQAIGKRIIENENSNTNYEEK
jgi:YesN/AraC family two-component response regulator